MTIKLEVTEFQIILLSVPIAFVPLPSNIKPLFKLLAPVPPFATLKTPLMLLVIIFEAKEASPVKNPEITLLVTILPLIIKLEVTEFQIILLSVPIAFVPLPSNIKPLFKLLTPVPPFATLKMPWILLVVIKPDITFALIVPLIKAEPLIIKLDVCSFQIRLLL